MRARLFLGFLALGLLLGCPTTAPVDDDDDTAVGDDDDDTGADEVCDNGLDDDGDAFIDCDDSDCVGDPACSGDDDDDDDDDDDTGADADGDGWLAAEDCDDNDANVFPGAEERCNGEDDDCDEAVPADESDGDADGWLICQGDCDDAQDTVFPGAEELCDGADSDCNGQLPEDEADTDGDGSALCEGDCDDEDDTIAPGASEICDGEDSDCDGDIPTIELDADADGATPCEGDCDDADETIAPGAAELCDGLDSNCDGVVPPDEADADLDGVPGCAGDCDDGDALIGPGAEERCNGVDDDCDFRLPEDERDSDGDGLRGCAGDCDDTDANVFSGAPERCNGVDDNCDGVIDEGFTDLDGDGLPDCVEGDLDGDGFSPEGGDCDDVDPSVFPGAAEICDGVDQNCDGVVDDGVSSSFWPDADGDGWGDGSAAPSEGCSGAPGTVDRAGDCDDADPAISPDAVEVCDEIDNNCDGAADEGLDLDGDGVSSCDGDCDDGDGSRYPGAPELCDLIDNDCDDSVDEEATPTWYEDTDDDGFGDPASGVSQCEAPGATWGLTAGDCDDGNADISPGAPPACDDIDTDCDGAVDFDLDGDGLSAFDCGGSDCNDEEAGVGPLAGGCPLGASCFDILPDHTADGLYLLDPDGAGVGVDAFTAQCDQTTDGGGWTLALDWDREFGGDSLIDLLDAGTTLFDEMSVIEEETTHLRIYDDNFTRDVFAWAAPLRVPNGGELRVSTHLQGVSMEGSAVFIFGAGAGDVDVFCADRLNRSNWSAAELDWDPDYSCGASSNNWTWDEERQIDAGGPLDAVHLHIFMEDASAGDLTRLYSLQTWVR